MAGGMGDIFDFSDLLKVAYFLLLVDMRFRHCGGFFDFFSELIVFNKIPEVGADHFEELAIGL